MEVRQPFAMTKEVLQSEAMIRLSIFLGIFALMSVWE
jgi:hypothetical protein